MCDGTKFGLAVEDPVMTFPLSTVARMEQAASGPGAGGWGAFWGAPGSWLGLAFSPEDVDNFEELLKPVIWGEGWFKPLLEIPGCQWVQSMPSLLFPTGDPVPLPGLGRGRWGVLLHLRAEGGVWGYTGTSFCLCL